MTDAPSGPERAAGREPGTPCPFCGSTDTEVISPFGQSLLTSQHHCRACRTYFEHVRWQPAGPGSAQDPPSVPPAQGPRP